MSGPLTGVAIDDRSHRASGALGLRALECRECQRTYPVEPRYSCDFCFGPLEATYDLDEIGARTSRAPIARGARSLWR